MAIWTTARFRAATGGGVRAARTDWSAASFHRATSVPAGGHGAGAPAGRGGWATAAPASASEASSARRDIGASGSGRADAYFYVVRKGWASGAARPADGAAT